MSPDQGGNCRLRRPTIGRKEANTLKLWKRYVVRRHRKEHERVEAERARQKALAGQDAQEAVRDNAKESAIGQGIWGAPGQ
jgi:hypothetical protein